MGGGGENFFLERERERGFFLFSPLGHTTPTPCTQPNQKKHPSLHVSAGERGGGEGRPFPLVLGSHPADGCDGWS